MNEQSDEFGNEIPTSQQENGEPPAKGSSSSDDQPWLTRRELLTGLGVVGLAALGYGVTKEKGKTYSVERWSDAECEAWISQTEAMLANAKTPRDRTEVLERILGIELYPEYEKVIQFQEYKRRAEQKVGDLTQGGGTYINPAFDQTVIQPFLDRQAQVLRIAGPERLAAMVTYTASAPGNEEARVEGAWTIRRLLYEVDERVSVTTGDVVVGELERRMPNLWGDLETLEREIQTFLDGKLPSAHRLLNQSYNHDSIAGVQMLQRRIADARQRRTAPPQP